MKFRSELGGPCEVHDWIFGSGPMPSSEDVASACYEMLETWARSRGRFSRRICADWMRGLADAIERENKQAAEQVAREAA